MPILSLSGTHQVLILYEVAWATWESQVTWLESSKAGLKSSEAFWSRPRRSRGWLQNAEDDFKPAEDDFRSDSLRRSRELFDKIFNKVMMHLKVARGAAEGYFKCIMTVLNIWPSCLRLLIVDKCNFLFVSWEIVTILLIDFPYQLFTPLLQAIPAFQVRLALHPKKNWRQGFINDTIDLRNAFYKVSIKKKIM